MCLILRALNRKTYALTPFSLQGGEGLTTSQDDEYRWAGVTDPKIMVTTSRDPSSRLKMFAKEIKLLFPNAQRLNRGGYEIQELVKACVANEVTDLVLLHETRGDPDQIGKSGFLIRPRLLIDWLID